MKALLRAPALLYEAGLGRFLGERFLCLTHIGRRSGRRYRTVLEVIGTDSLAGEFVVIAGFGTSSDWYRNIAAHPACEVVVGRHQFVPQHRVLDTTEAVAVLADYERRNRWILPIVHLLLSKLLGWRYDGSQEAREHLAGQLALVAFRRASAAAHQAG
jgi:deazaflavin-dependent oxidoreductase (nitroreductase family)